VGVGGNKEGILFDFELLTHIDVYLCMILWFMSKSCSIEALIFSRCRSPLPPRSQTVFDFASSFGFLLRSFNGLKHDSILVISSNFQLDSFGWWTPHLFSMVDMRHLKQSVPSVKVLEKPIEFVEIYNVIYNVSDGFWCPI
jgi:hypothetical protein